MNPTNVTDETLTFYYYNDGLSSRERQDVAHALTLDVRLAARYRQLSSQLNRFAELPLSTPPSDMTERWHDSIRSAASREASTTPRPALHTWSFILGFAITAAFALGIGIGVLLPDDDTGQPDRFGETFAVNEPASAFARGLQVHLRESEAGLSNLDGNSTMEKNELIMNIIQQNRLFERAAEQNDSQGVARVLRAFELVLIQIAAEETTAEDAEELRAKLLFELNIMLTKLARDTSNNAQTI